MGWIRGNHHLAVAKNSLRQKRFLLNLLNHLIKTEKPVEDHLVLILQGWEALHLMVGHPANRSMRRRGLHQRPSFLSTGFSGGVRNAAGVARGRFSSQSHGCLSSGCASTSSSL